MKGLVRSLVYPQLMESPLRRIRSAAPIRVCDNGGWTDTWFAEHGAIFNIAVSPACEVQVDVFERSPGEPQVELHAENYGERYEVDPKATSWDRHPLLEAAIQRMGVPENLRAKVSLFSEAPAGASTGTSAAVTVALLGALDALTPGTMSPHQVARTAWSVETEMLGQQCGIQDQLASALGGINYIEMFQYPNAEVSQLRIPDPYWWELDRRLVLIFLGKSHQSSEVHRQVIRRLEEEGAGAPALGKLRSTAPESRDAVYAGDWGALGAAMSRNTEYQRELHPELVSSEAERIWRIAESHGALGWKVNGAGGDGGSVTLLCGPDAAEKRTLIREIEAENPRWRSIRIGLSRTGLRVWEV